MTGRSVIGQPLDLGFLLCSEANLGLPGSRSLSTAFLGGQWRQSNSATLSRAPGQTQELSVPEW
jgi:hypothetical protein